MCSACVECMRERRNAYRLLVIELELKRQLWRPRCRYEDNINLDFREIGWSGMTGFFWLRMGTSGESSCEHSNEPFDSITLLTPWF
jgi:hypothetical protein